MGALTQALPPTHDLETLTYWLAMAREAGIPLQDERESITIIDEDDDKHATLYSVPTVSLNYQSVTELNPETIE
ncbi:MAG: DUF3375 domain-containing protein, partial [Verrucomicrobiota bacterium]